MIGITNYWCVCIAHTQQRISYHDVVAYSRASPTVHYIKLPLKMYCFTYTDILLIQTSASPQ